jgi:hypothetical protein
MQVADETGPEGSTSAVSGMNATAEPVTDGELEAKTPKVLGSRTLAKAAGEFSDFLEGLGADEVDEPDIDVENELETVEEHQVVIFFFPERNLLFSIGDLDTKGPLVEACRATLLNPKSAVLSDLLGDADGSDGCGTLMVVMLDSCIDQVFPIMDVYGDALEGLRILCQEGPKYPPHKGVELFEEPRYAYSSIPLGCSRVVYGALARHVRRDGGDIEGSRSESAREHSAAREGGRGQHRAVPRS